MSNEIEVRAAAELPIAQRTKNEADLLVIDCAEMYTIADEMLTEAHSFIKRVEAAFADPVSKAKAAYTSVTALRDSILKQAESAKASLRKKMAEFKEKERIAIEQAARDAEQARQAEIAAAETALIATEARVAAGDEPAEAIERAEADVAIAHVGTMAPTVEAVRGSSSVAQAWSVEITDLPTLLEAIAADLRKDAPRFDNTVDVKIGQLKDYAKSTNGRPFPGVIFKKVASIRARA